MIGPGIDWRVQVPRPVSGALPRPGTAAVPKPQTTLKPLVKLPSDPQLALALTSINTHRSHHQVSPVTWDDRLAARAAEYAKTCPLRHSNVPGVGETLAWGYVDFGDVVDSWYGQSNSYKSMEPGFVVPAGDFTQLVWKDTSKVGCAVNKACRLSIWTCWYDPPGERG
jgi:uncharacterized protein YkwD